MVHFITVLLLLLLLDSLKPLDVLIDVVSELLPQVLHIVVQLGGQQHHQVHQLLRAALSSCLLLIGNKPKEEKIIFWTMMNNV